MMVVIPETNLLTLSVSDDGCYSRNQSFDFGNNKHHQARSKSKDWFLE
jgi:hypothetical protein